MGYYSSGTLKRAIREDDGAFGGLQSDELRDFLDAGAEIVLEQGSDALSFRSVADKAERTFASVSSVFRKKDVLVSSICQHMVDRAMSAAPPPLTGRRDLTKICEITCDLLTGGNDLHGDYYFLGHVEIRMLAARNPHFSSLARQMRMMNGLYPLRHRDRSYDLFGPEAFAVHAREIWSRGTALIQTAIQDKAELRSSLLDQLISGSPNFELS